MTRLLLPGLLLALISGALPARAALSDILPDTLMPCGSYSFQDTGRGGYVPGDTERQRDSLFLRGNGESHTLRPGFSTVGWWTYFVSLPCQAKPGILDAYTKGGSLIEARVSMIPDLAAMTPVITGFFPAKAIRSISKSHHAVITGKGLVFGRLPAQGSYGHSIKAVWLERLGSVIVLDPTPASFPGQYRDPFRLDADFTVPEDAPLGRYSLFVERQDGVRTMLGSAFEVWIPPAPIIQAVTPESLHQVNGGIITLTGINMEYGIRQGSYVGPDPEIVKSVFLRKDDRKIAGKIVNTGSGGALAGISARFGEPFVDPFSGPLGTYDVGLYLEGRADTAFLEDAVRVVEQGVPALVSITPSKGGRRDYVATIRSRFFMEALNGAAFSLERGAVSVPGRVTYGGIDFAQVRFEVSESLAIGFYDVVAARSGVTMRLSRGAEIRLPEVGILRPPYLPAGKATEAEIQILYPDSLSRLGNFINVRACREGTCMAGEYAAGAEHYVKFAFTPAAGGPHGLYDLELGIATTTRVLRKEAAFLVTPPGYAPFLVRRDWEQVPYMIVPADSQLAIGLASDVTACGPQGYGLAEAPCGMSLSRGVLAWTPGKADIGWHYVSLSPAGGCKEGVYLAIRVEERQGSAIRPRGKAAGGGGPALLGVIGGAFRLRLAEAAGVEIRTLEGRLLGDYGRLPSGWHALPLPPGAGKANLLLCRVRQAGGDAWLRLVTSP